MRLFKVYLIIMTVVMGLTATSCRSHRHVQKGNAPDIADETHIPNDSKAGKTVGLDSLRVTDFHQYNANFSCTVDGVHINGQIRMVNDSIIWISASKIVELGRVVITPTRIKAYINIVNKFFDGDYTDFSNRCGIDIDYGTLQALLLGDLPPSCSLKQEPRTKDNEVTLLYNQSISPSRHARLVTVTKEMSENKSLCTEVQCQAINQRLRCSYTTLTETGGQLLPTEISTVLNSKNYNIATLIHLEKIQLNRPLSFPFKIPEKYKEL